MNYRHAYHAGGFADVVKHAVLARVIMHLRQKPAAFRVLDTHAGAGLYDLTSAEAQKTREADSGIGALMAALSRDDFFAPARELLAPYLDALAGFNAGGEITTYPGSPALAAALLRPVDRLLACETEPTALAALAASLARDRRAKALNVDGWTALSAYLPPKERRGVVLIDPPFEERNEFPRLAAALGSAHRKWPSGIYLAWYPLKDAKAVNAFAKRMSGAGIPGVLRAEVALASRPAADRLGGTGLLLINPPWRLDDELRVLLPALAKVFAPAQGVARIDWLAGEK
ncbi:MAG: 23S rRNA (adenine(2030)-N(6))-methyltransferase RlmJ [Variibacter sp.]